MKNETIKRQHDHMLQEIQIWRNGADLRVKNTSTAGLQSLMSKEDNNINWPLNSSLLFNFKTLYLRLKDQQNYATGSGCRKGASDPIGSAVIDARNAP